jgi:Tfp pilus assembly protein PilO
MNFDFISKISIKSKLIATLVLLVIFTAGIGYFIILPLAADIENIKDGIEAKREEVERKYQQRKQMGDITKKLDNIRSQIDVLNRPFVLNSKNLEFITKLEQIAADSNVEQDLSLLVNKQESKDFYKVIPVEIKTAGDIRSQMEYLAKLESLDKYINIDYLIINSSSAGTFKKEEQSDGGQGVDMLINADTYWADKVEIDNQ